MAATPSTSSITEHALNRLYIENGALEGEESYATLFFAIVEPHRRAMHYVSAGHDAAFLIAHRTALWLRSTGPIIGLAEHDAAFDHCKVRLGAGSIIAVATDGFSEARNANRTLHAERQACAVTRRACEYACGRVHDDVAALVVKLL